MHEEDKEKKAQSSRSNGSALSNRDGARVFNSDGLGWGVRGDAHHLTPSRGRELAQDSRGTQVLL